MKVFRFLFAVAMITAIIVPVASVRTPQNDSNNRRPSTRRLSKGSKGSSSKGSKKSGKSYKVETIVSSAASHNDPVLVYLPPVSKSSKASSHASKSSKSSSTSVYQYSAKSSKSSGAKSLKSGKASEGTKAGKAYVNVFTDSSQVVIITNAPTPPPTSTPQPTPQPTKAASDSIQSTSIKTFIVQNEYSCTGNPCPIEGWCRSHHDTCGPGRMYCNVYSIWTQLCPTLEPTKEPTLGPMMAQPLLPRFSTDSSANFMSVPEIPPEVVEIPDSLLLEGIVKKEEPLTLSYTDNEKQSHGGGAATSGVPTGGYVAIALSVAAFIIVVALLAKRKDDLQRQEHQREQHPLNLSHASEDIQLD